MALSLGMVAGPLPVRAASVVLEPEAEADQAPAAVLGLDCDDSQRGAALTQALKRAFAKRGMSGGKDANLTELRLALGCSSDDPSCLAAGGQTLGARRLIYGSLRLDDRGSWQVELNLLEVESAQVTSTSAVLTEADLESRFIDTTAERLAMTLVPDAGSDTPEAASGTLVESPPPPPPSGDPGDAGAPADEGKGKGKIVFGIQRPTPRWKWAGFGTSVGLLVVGGAATVGMGVWLTRQDGGFRGQLLDAAEASLTDQNPLNDIDPNSPEGVNLCDYARERPTDPETGQPLGQEGQVRNHTVVAVCNQASDVRTAQVGAGIFTAIAGVSTLVFTGLLLIHRDSGTNKGAARRWRHHRMQLAVEPGRGGLAVRLGGRF